MMRSMPSACTRVGGATGAILTGVFAVSAYGGTAGLIEGNAGQVLNQLIGVGIVVVYDVIVTLIILWVVNMVIGLRVSRGCRARGSRPRAPRRDRAVANSGWTEDPAPPRRWEALAQSRASYFICAARQKSTPATLRQHGHRPLPTLPCAGGRVRQARLDKVGPECGMAPREASENAKQGRKTLWCVTIYSPRLPPRLVCPRPARMRKTR